jgi:hypothetical protein
MLKYRGLRIEHQHGKGCDHRAQISHARAPQEPLMSVSAGDLASVIRRAEQAIDKLIGERHKQRERGLRNRRLRAEHLDAVLSGRRAAMTLLLYKWSPAQQDGVIDALLVAAENGTRLSLSGGLPFPATLLQRQRLARALYRGKGQLLSGWARLERLRVAHCHACRHPLDSRIDLGCSACGWLLCLCGGCGCNYSGPRG